MRNFIIVTAVFLILTGVLATLARSEDIKEGQWSITTVHKFESIHAEGAASTTEMEDVPAQGTTMTQTKCVTHQSLLHETSIDESCQQTHELNGNTVHYHVLCPDEDMSLETTGQMVFNGDSMEGQLKAHMEGHDESADETVQITGKYLGPCP